MQRPFVARRAGGSTTASVVRSAVVWRSQTRPVEQWRWAPIVVSIGLIGWWVALLAQVLLGARDQAQATAATAATTATAEGSLFNTGIVLAFAALGVWFWPWGLRLPSSVAMRLLVVV